MLELKITFTQFRQRIEAAAAVQEAGEDVEARSLFRKLASDILEKVKDDAG